METTKINNATVLGNPRTTEDEYKSNILKVLNCYADSLLQAQNNAHFVNGAIAVVRHALEYMGAYLMLRHHKGIGNGILIRAGVNVYSNKTNKNAQVLETKYIAGMDMLVNRMRELYFNCNKYMHFNCTADEYKDENLLLRNERTEIAGCINKFCGVLSSFLQETNLDCSKYTRIKTLINLTSMGEFAFNVCENDLDNNSSTAWIDFYSRSLETCRRTVIETQASPAMHIIYSTLLSVRKLAEYVGYHFVLARVEQFNDIPDIDITQGTTEAMTLEWYCQRSGKNLSDKDQSIWEAIGNRFFSIREGEYDKWLHWRDDCYDNLSFSQKSEWANKMSGLPGCLATATINATKIFTAYFASLNIDYSESVLSFLHLEEDAVAQAQEEIKSLEKRVEEQRRRMYVKIFGKLIRKSHFAVGVLGVILSLALIITGVLVANGTLAIPMPGDPKPQIVEATGLEYTENDIVEIPYTEVTLSGIDNDYTVTSSLNEDSFVIAKRSSLRSEEAQNTYRVSFEMSAHCDGKYSSELAKNTRYMRTQGANTNESGVVNLAYELFKLSESAEPLQVEVRWKGNGDKFKHTYTLEPGWYELRVQAVGAADGYKAEGKTVRAASGWRCYKFLLLPTIDPYSNDSMSVLAWNESRKYDSIQKSDIVYAYEGDVIKVECYPEVSDWARFYYTWDDSQEMYMLEDSGDVTVPNGFNSGLHTLHIQARYRDDNGNEQIIDSPAYRAKVACNIRKDLVNKTVNLTVQNADGTIAADGGILPYNIGEKIYITATGEKGTPTIHLQTIMAATNEVSRDERFVDGNASFEMNEVLSGACIVKVEVFGKGYAGEDSSEYLSMSFIPMARTHEDVYDEQGNISIDYLYDDVYSNVPTKYVKHEYAYNEQGETMVESYSYWNMDDTPALGYNTYHKFEKKYLDDERKGCEWKYFGLDGELVLVGDFAGFYSEYLGNNTYLKYGIDLNGNPSEENIVNSAARKVVYDENGNIREEYALNANFEPTLSKYGWYAYYSNYDDKGRETEAWFTDINGDECNTLYEGGFSRKKIAYDDIGNILEEKLTRTDGKIVGWYKQTFVPNTNLRLTWTNFTDGEVKADSDEYGYASLVTTYDPNTAKRLSTAFYNAYGRSVLCKDGYSIEVWQYDKNGYTIKHEYQDAEGKAIVCAAGEDCFATVEWDVDAYGNIEEVRYKNAEGDLVNPRNENYGAARATYRYTLLDGEYKLSHEQYYNADGTGHKIADSYCGISYVYSSDGITRYFLDEDGNYTTAEGEDNWSYFDRSFTSQRTINGITYEDEYRYFGDALADETNHLQWVYDEDGNLIRRKIWYSGEETHTISMPCYLDIAIAKDPLTGANYWAEYSRYTMDNERLADSYGMWRMAELRVLDTNSGCYTIETRYYDRNNLLMNNTNYGDYAIRKESYFFDGENAPSDKYECKKIVIERFGLDELPMNHVPGEYYGTHDYDSFGGAKIIIEKGVWVSDSVTRDIYSTYSVDGETPYYDENGVFRTIYEYENLSDEHYLNRTLKYGQDLEPVIESLNVCTRDKNETIYYAMSETEYVYSHETEAWESIEKRYYNADGALVYTNE